MANETDHEIPDLLDVLLTRHSVGPKHLHAPGPSEAGIEAALRAAMRAPDHHGLHPYVFVTIDDGQRAKLADLFEDYASRRGKPPEDVRREGERAYNGPVLVAMVARIQADHPEVPVHEQWMCAGGALTNFLTALHVMGYGAKIVSGGKAADPAISAALCAPEEKLIGWIVIGTPTSPVRARGEDDIALIARKWS